MNSNSFVNYKFYSCKILASDHKSNEISFTHLVTIAMFKMDPQ